jgi:hypothetical protein
MKVPKGTLFIVIIILFLSLSMNADSFYNRMPKVQAEDLWRLELLSQDAGNYMLQEIANPDSSWHKEPGKTVFKQFYVDGPKEGWFEGKITFDSANNLYYINITAFINDGLMAGINGLVTRVISYEDQFGFRLVRNSQIIAFQRLEIQAEFSGGRLKVLSRKKL